MTQIDPANLRTLATAIASLRDMATGNIADPVINRAAMRRIANRLERISASPDAERIAELEAKLKTTRNTALINLLAAKNAIARAKAAEAEAARLRAALTEARDYVGKGHKPAGLLARIDAALSAEAKPEEPQP